MKSEGENSILDAFLICSVPLRYEIRLRVKRECFSFLQNETISSFDSFQATNEEKLTRKRFKTNAFYLDKKKEKKKNQRENFWAFNSIKNKQD